MKDLQKIHLDLGIIERNLLELKSILTATDEIEEKTLLDFFQKRPQLIAFMGVLTDFGQIDRYAYEFPIASDLRTDFVIGSSEDNSYLLVEFESGKSDSIFKKKTRSLKEFSASFEHGYSQVIDWFWQIEDIFRTELLSRKFGSDTIDYNGLLVIGRNKGLLKDDFKRLKWRKDKVIINSKKIHCLTFDQLLEALEQKMKLLKSIPL